MDRTSPLATLWYALAGGLCGGSLVGVSEALYVLSASRPAEYQALVYGAVLYGVIGALIGAGIGVGLAIAGRLFRLSPAVSWCFGFFGVDALLGFVILKYIVNKSWYSEQGVPMTTTLGLLAGLGATALVGIWLGGHLLTKTPLRVIPTPKGSLGLWSAGVAVSFMLSLAPAPGATGVMAPHHPQAASFADKPDVILIMIDTTRADALGVYGAPEGSSPNIDAFAKDAVVFDQHITSASWTRASTASLLTSLSPSTHACETKDAGLSDDVVTLAEVMRDGGYATGGFPNNANVTGAQGFDQGFDYFPYAPEYPLGASESTYALSLYSAVRKIYTKIDTKKRVESYYMPAETQFARAESFIDAQGKDRYFLFVHLMEPHDPYFVHPWTGEAYGRAEFPNPDPSKLDYLKGLYKGEVKHADEEVGKFLAKLKAEGRYDNTMIVVTADHGEEFLEHGGWWHGTTLYDEMVHTPLIVKLPKNERAGTRVAWQVRQVDVAPTVAEAAGLTPHPTWQGTTLFTDHFDADLAMMQPPPAEEPTETADAATAGTAAGAVPAAPAFVAPTWANHPSSEAALSEQNFEGYDLKSLRTDGHKVIQALAVPVGNARKQPPQAAYDIMNDPREQTDLSGKGAAWEAAMANQIDTMVSKAKETRVNERGVAVSDAERARLEALGYIQKDVVSTPTGDAKPGDAKPADGAGAEAPK